MADYREISQTYAQGAIRTTVIINGGAAIAILSQASSLANQGISQELERAMVLWVVGIVCGAASWLLAFVSARYVDKSERERIREPEHVRTSNAFMYLTIASVLASFGLFLAGALTIAAGFGRVA